MGTMDLRKTMNINRKNNMEFISRQKLNKEIDESLKRDKFVCDVFLGINNEKSFFKWLLIKYRFLRLLYFKIF